MREMKDSGVAWIGEIPEEWDLLRFKDHYKNIKEVAGEKSFEYDRLALTLNGVIKRKKDDSDGLQPKEFDGYQILRKNDFIFKMIDLQNISTSRVGLSQYTGLVSPAYIRFTPRKKDSFNKFVYYYLMSMYYNCVFNNLGGNGVRSALNASDMGRLMIPYPKIETQHQIATYLDQKCTQIDALITNQQKQIEKLKAYKQSLITETVTKGLNPDVPMKDSGVAWIGEIPEEWDLLRFKDHYKNIKEVAGEKSFEYDRLALTLNGVIKRKKDDSDGLQPKEFDGYQILRKNDFIFKMIDLQNISTSRVGLSQYTGLVSPAYIRFTPRKKDSFNKFVYYYLMSMYYNCVFNNLGGNGVRSALNASDMGRLMIPYPKIETQHQIATYLDQKCTQIDNLIAIKQQKIEKLQQYKKSLIYEYVTGKKEI